MVEKVPANITGDMSDMQWLKWALNTEKLTLPSSFVLTQKTTVLTTINVYYY